MSAVLKRIKVVAEQEGVSITALEATIGASKGVFSRALANGTDIQSKWLVRLVEKYPQYAPEWLLTGQGDMRKGDVSRDSHERYVSDSDEKSRDELVEALKQIISSQDITIRSQVVTIATLQNRIAELEKYYKSPQ